MTRIVVSLDRCEDAAAWLVRTRLDREGGTGTYSDALARVAAGGPGAARIGDALDRAREGARWHVGDVL